MTDKEVEDLIHLLRVWKNVEHEWEDVVRLNELKDKFSVAISAEYWKWDLNRNL